MEGIDLKHMRVFLRLVRERSASRVAEQAGMSQQAVSGYLKRLRAALPHEIFLRHSAGLEPTDFAMDVAQRFERILADVDDVLYAGAFEPASLNRSITLIANEYAQLSILPKLFAKIRFAAPGVTLKVLDFERRGHVESLADGDAELALGFSAFVDDSLARVPLVDEHYCCVAGEGVPPGVSATDVLDRYPRVDFAQSNSYSDDAVSQYLIGNGISSPPIATLACYTSLAPFLQCNDVVAFVPSAIADAFGFRRVLPDVEARAFTVVAAWHRKTAGNPIGIWLRELVRECV